YTACTVTDRTASYTPSLHDALPICRKRPRVALRRDVREPAARADDAAVGGLEEHAGVVRIDDERMLVRVDPIRCVWSRVATGTRSEEHTSELQSHLNLVCRLLLEKK